MTRRAILTRWTLLVLTAVQGATFAASPIQRAVNTTLSLPTEPPRHGFTTAPVFVQDRAGVPVPVAFSNPIAIASPPGETNRLFVALQGGRIMVVSGLDAPAPTVFLDISSKIAGGTPSDERGLLGFVFHPGYATNRFFYVFYTGNHSTAAGTGLHDKLVRFQTSPVNPETALVNSEQVLIAQFDQANNHNGGDLHFAPDGYLYVSLGDEGGGNDTYGNSQWIDRDFFAGILRLDVDQRPSSLPPNAHPAVGPGTYAVPSDNPYVGATQFNGRAVSPNQVRTEFYAVGLRNPWRFSIDAVSGTIYCGDVGQGLWEEIDVILQGGNYGWNFYEASAPGPRAPPSGFTSIRPILEYAHGNQSNQGYSVTGGVLYRGARLSQLFGQYLFADYVSGHVWATRPNGTNRVPFQRIASNPGISAFGVDPRNGDVLLADQNQDTIKRLNYDTNVTGTPFPEWLSQTGAFADLASLQPNTNIYPYDINAPFWSDNARKTRFFALKDGRFRINFSREENWSFPSGTTWIKHFELELTPGVPSSARRLETRFLVRTTDGVYGITYRWNETQTDAALVPDEGLDETFVIHNPDGSTREQVWHYPSRSECLVCHTAAAGLALGFNTAQLNREFNYNGITSNQIDALNSGGFFSAPVTNLHSLRALAHLNEDSASPEYRVRSYLQANCAQCHQPGAPGGADFDARVSTPTDLAGLIHGPLRDPKGNPASRVIVPGQPEHSMLLDRLESSGPGRMPPLASNLLDTNAIALIRHWIRDVLPAEQTFAQWQTNHFTSPTLPEAALEADPDGDHAINWAEFVTRTDPKAAADLWRIEAEWRDPGVRIHFERLVNLGFEIEYLSGLDLPLSWRSLDLPGNRPFFFSSTNRMDFIDDPTPNSSARYYRIRLREP